MLIEGDTVDLSDIGFWKNDNRNYDNVPAINFTVHVPKDILIKAVRKLRGGEITPFQQKYLDNRATAGEQLSNRNDIDEVSSAASTLRESVDKYLRKIFGELSPNSGAISGYDSSCYADDNSQPGFPSYIRGLLKDAPGTEFSDKIGDVPLKELAADKRDKFPKTLQELREGLTQAVMQGIDEIQPSQARRGRY